MSRSRKGNDRKNAGFTLVEIIVALSLVGLVMGVTGGFINFSFTAEKTVEDEYVLQSEMRLATEILNNAIRDASVTFVMPGAVSPDKIRNKWSYLGVSENEKEIVQYLWTEDPDGSNGKHVKKVLVADKDKITYRLRFGNKEKTKLISYNIKLDKEGGKSLTVASEVSAINSVAVDYTSSEKEPAALIAYRSDPRPQPEGNKKVSVVISMVLDDSGSMRYNMNGGTNTSSTNKARKTIMKAKADVLIDSFPENVKLGIVRFATDANNPSSLIELTSESKKTEAKDKIPQNANGGTNTGDGLRRAYHQLKGYSKSPGEEVLYYIILLTDGNPTYYSHTKRNGYTSSDDSTKVNADDYQVDADNMKYRGGTGSGDPKDNCINYTKTVGEKLLRADTGLKVKTFVIGFSGVSDEIIKAKTIASNCNPTGTNIDDIYFYANDEQSLGIAFDAIKESILLELWHIYGPYGKPEE